LLVANSTYPNDAHNLPDLEGPRNDPGLLRDALCDDRYGLFPVDNVRLVSERTMAEVLRETEDFLRTARRDDTLLLYYSGHGKLDLSGQLYLCARDTRVDRLRSTAVKASDLSAMIEESAAATTVILLDCCHSGAFKGGELAQALAGRGRFVVTSCRTGELANDAHRLNRASMFTHHLVAGVLGGVPDHDGDGLVGLNDLYAYVHARLTAEHRQIPQRSFAGAGDVPVARRPGVPAAPPETAQTPGPDASASDPSASDPVLAVSETVIDLGQVDHDEDLPPERIAVVNRGGGDLRWSAECAAGWVTLVRDDYGLLLHLRPGPGTNRANVHVRDDRTGMVKTVRLVVRAPAVREPAPARREPSMPVSTPEPQPRDEPPPEHPEPESSPGSGEPESARATAEPGAVPVGDTRRALRWFRVATGAAAVAGVWLTLSGLEFLDLVEYHTDAGLFLRDRDLGPGLGAGILGGAVLVGVACAALLLPARRRAAPASWRRLLLGLGCGLAAPLAVARAVMSFRWEPAWFFGEQSASFGDVAVLLGLVAAVLCGLALRANGATDGAGSWAPGWALPAGVVSAGLWGVASAVPVFTREAWVRTYFQISGELNEERAGGVDTTLAFAMSLLVVVLMVAVVVATERLTADAGRGVLAGAATFLVLVEIIEVATTLFRDSESRQGLGLGWMLVPAAVYVGTVVVAIRRSGATRSSDRRSPEAAPSAGSSEG
jgi:hypothetical protein